MNNSHVITCGGIVPGETVLKDRQCLRLDLWGINADANVWLHIEDIHDKLHWNIPDAFQDLVEIATYVYCADQSIRRDANDVNTFGAHWRRQLDFHIPVRCPDLWSSDAMQNALRTTVGFLSDDYYSFTFQAGKAPFAFQQYLELKGSDGRTGEPEQVMMFSGGLDSLAGAIEEAVVQKRRVMLVNHQSTPKLNRKHQELLQLLGKKTNGFTPGHLRVRVNKDSEMTKDYLQRSRSFLYAAIGGAVAHALGLQSLRFYENGVVGLNLPGCAQVVGGRATRTAHPRVLAGFEQVLSLVAGRDFKVENPFNWLTRGEIIKKIVDAGCGELIGASMTCSHTWQISNAVTHCGMCSQCIDRRFAMIAADAEKWDPSTQYGADIFTETPPKEEDKTMLATYIERANGVKELDSVRKFVTRFPEVLEAVPYLGGQTESVAARVLDLYRRHAKEVAGAVTNMIRRYTPEIIQRSLPGDCLLRIVYESQCPEYTPASGAEGRTKSGLIELENKQTNSWSGLQVGEVFEPRVMVWNGKPFYIEEPARCYKGYDLEEQSLEDYFPELHDDWNRYIRDVPFDEVENLRVLQLVGYEKTLSIYIMLKDSVPVYPERLESSDISDGGHDGCYVIVNGQRFEAKGLHVEPTEEKVRAKIQAARRLRNPLVNPSCVSPETMVTKSIVKGAGAKIRKRSTRTVAIDSVKNALRLHIRAARDHAFSTQRRTGTPKLLPRPTQEALARQLKVHVSSISRAIRDKSDSEIAVLWDIANSVDQVMSFKK